MTRKSKHLLLTLEYPPASGGVGVYLANLVNNCHSYDFKVVSENLYYRWFWPRWLKSFFTLAGVRGSFKFEVLHVSHVLPMGYVALLARLFWRVKYAVYLHGLDFNLTQKSGWKKYWTRRILRHAAVVVVNSEFLRKKILDFAGPINCEVIYPTMNTKLVQALVDDLAVENIKNKFGVQPDVVTILSVGRLVRRKGQHLVISALKNLSAQIPDFKYIIVGDGPEKENLEKLIKDNDLEGKVFLTGAITPEQGLANYYRAADIFAMPTVSSGGDEEGFGIVYLEAGMFGLLVIGGQGEGVKEAIAEGETGFIVNSSDELENVLKKLFLDKNLRVQMGEAGKGWAQKFLYPEDYLANKLDKYFLN